MKKYILLIACMFICSSLYCGGGGGSSSEGDGGGGSGGAIVEAVTGIVLAKESTTILKGNTETLTVTINPASASNKNLTWSSSNEAVATVSAGVVTGIADGGPVAITVTASDTTNGILTDTCDVTVTSTPASVAGVTLNKDTIDIGIGEQETLIPAITPSGATNQNVTWTSSDGSVATVSGGIVAGLKLGTATITVTAVDTTNGNLTDTCSVTVSDRVYIAGRVGNTTNGFIPVYWKDGEIKYLPLTSGYTDGNATGITVDSSGNIYVAGLQAKTEGDYIFGFWKNSTFVTLGDSDSYAFYRGNGIAVDTTGNIWFAAMVGASNNASVPKYWKNAAGPYSLKSATNVFAVKADILGNICFIGTLSGSSVFCDTVVSTWRPAGWWNGGEGYNDPGLEYESYGNISNAAGDSSGNMYIVGAAWGSTTPIPVYWEEKHDGDGWGSMEELSKGSYSSYYNWNINGVAIDSTGNFYAEAIAAPDFSTITVINNYYYYDSTATNPINLVYWDGASSNPVQVPLGAYTYVRVFVDPGAVDSDGNYFIAGSLASSSDDASNNQGIPVYWKNGGNPVQLSLGINGIANTFGEVFAIAIH